MKVSRFQNPDYTGRNRCIPCTAVNIILSLVFTALLYTFSPISATIFFGISLALIYFRGYLIPGTPTLTKQYFPNWILGYFGKNTRNQVAVNIHPEKILSKEGIIQVDPDSGSVSIPPSISQEFHQKAPQTDSFPVDELKDALGSGHYNIEVDESNGTATATLDNQRFSQWPSITAAISDVGAASILEAQLSEWAYYSPPERAALLRGFRTVVERCPSCEDDVVVVEETRESCCSTREVVSVECEGCENDLLELPKSQLAQ